ncbi:chromosome segregation protein SMC [Streptosporangium sp. NBC_01755]|uniref:chromosome segregation protein SMC n=1 Tax=unclassified Streptosporangium TaxID=2632669 RepID=UPI002DDB9516|nr:MULTISPECIES: chromosome segregation protein SMC [unclassified Streptosporangium]WSA26579.1 chromosome segregation protein SMC [Streptosporangium sp. NBC_01810]WSD01997.1 chromosome segregation protein SMC [Streptosporangium sp. NBC_01755]
MYLKTLTLRGFKSFASATTLRFEPGITAVVGPNGSGKSNVVDALAWVMGEHSAKSLRGGKMEDVIFAGTSSRAPLGRAEVTLTIDNTDGMLPIDYTEVTISRLMFRAGQSEYAINGDICRLLDIQELLSDSGIGREMHVIVGQGQLDQVLHAGPEERRAFIEEAAGVLKHRKRKEKALRKLDAMQANMTRVQDLTTELRRQLKPLGRQAEIARRAAVIQADLRDARLRLLADDVLTLRTTLEREMADEAAVLARRTAVEIELEQGQAAEAELEGAEAEAQPRLAAAQETFFRLSSLRERLRGLAGLAAERHRHATDNAVERRGRDPEDFEREAEEVREQERVLVELLEGERESLAEAVARRAETEAALAAEERRLGAEARAAADRREGLARLRGQAGAARSRAGAAEEEIGRLRRSLEEAEQRAEGARAEYDGQESAEPTADPALAEELEIALETVEQARESVESARAGGEEVKAAVAGPNAALAAARAALAAARKADQQAQRQVAALEARFEALELGLAGGADGGAALLAADLAGVLGPVATMLSVRAGAEEAIAAVLGADAEAVAVESLQSAADAIEFLRGHDGGRAGLVIAAGGAAVPPGQVPQAGAEWAIDLVTVSAELRAAATHLLAGVLVVDDLAIARKTVEQYPELRAVTRSGDLLGAHVAGGGSAGGTSAIQMRAALDEAAADLAEARVAAELAAMELEETAQAEGEAQLAVETAQARVADAQTGVQNTQAAFNAAQAALDRVRARQRDVDQKVAAVARRLAQLDAAAKAAREECERLAGGVRAAEEARDRDTAGFAELEERLAEAVGAEEQQSEPGTDLRDELAEICATARQDEMEARLTVRTAEERVRSIDGRAEELTRAAEREREERARAAEHRERRREQARTAQAVVRGAELALRALETSLTAAAGERDEAERARGQIDASLKAVRVRVRELTGELDKLVNRAHGSEVARTEQRLRLEQLQGRAVEEYGVETETLIAEYGPGEPVPTEDGEPIPYDREEQLKRARAADRQMAQLGKVNPLALEEFAALEERHAFLTSQLEDLKKTRRDLLLVVKEVDERVEQVFGAAFADVAREFETIFTRVFPGGEGRLLLTDPQDMLTTGVEVEARPPGKKVKRLSLLSGGERSLTAVAFLVSIFKARPSPFYVMDEVEAALDDTNTQRLLTLFEELRQTSQIIIITHQKRTMEIADALYGVSMRGDGVTQVISQRLRENEPA